MLGALGLELRKKEVSERFTGFQSRTFWTLCLESCCVVLYCALRISGNNPSMGEFTTVRGTILGVQIMRIIVFWGLHWDPLILGNNPTSIPVRKLISSWFWVYLNPKSM